MDEREEVLNQFINDNFKDKKLKDYWTLTENEKNMITNEVFYKWKSRYKRDEREVMRYIFLLDERMEDAIEIELFEEMDIIQRIKNKVIKEMSISKLSGATIS